MVMYGFPDGRRVVYRYMGTSRRAIVTGTIRDAAGVDWGQLADGDGRDGYGDLFSVHTGDVVIQR